MADLRIVNNKVALIDDTENIIYNLPDSSGSNGQFLQTDGANNLSFAVAQQEIVAMKAVENEFDDRTVNNFSATTVRFGNVKYDTHSGFQDDDEQYEFPQSGLYRVSVSVGLDRKFSDRDIVAAAMAVTKSTDGGVTYNEGIDGDAFRGGSPARGITFKAGSHHNFNQGDRIRVEVYANVELSSSISISDAPDEVIQLSPPTSFRTQGSITYLDILRIGNKTV